MYLRKRKGKEDLLRYKERKGISRLKRPAGKLLWLHGSSVGETVSMLPLIEKYLSVYPDLHIIVTSGTITSAEIMRKRLPKRAFHQYIPIDHPRYTKRFIKHWHPDGILWFESDFWPSMLSEIKKNKIPLGLVNGRISDKSFRGWKKWLPHLITRLLEMFTVLLGQSEHDAKRLQRLGGKNVYFEGNLKFASRALSYDRKDYEQLSKAIGNRKVFLISSTHNDEEARFIKIYKELKSEFQDLLLIISPRHPHRGEEIEKLYKKAGIKVARRSNKEELKEETEVYLADTLGEMGLFYKLSPIVFIGGSLIEHGGQNFLECLHFSDVVISGPHMHNFRLLMKQAKKYDAILQRANEEEIKEAIRELLADDNHLQRHRNNADNFIKNQNNILDKIFLRITEEIKI